MKVVFVLVDALKSLYLTEENMPFLYSLSQKGYYIRQIIPCSGFCERSEIFSGLDGYDTGNFTAIGYLPEVSPYKDDGLMLGVFNIIKMISPRLYGRIFRHWRKVNNKAMNGYRIPPRSLKKFALTEDGEKKLISHNNIFQSLDENGLSYSLDGFTSLADLKRRTEQTVEDLVSNEISKRTDFIPVYIGETDSIGHQYGSDIEHIRPTLRSVDKKLNMIYEMSRKAGYAFCVMGDHGMVPVEKKVDILSVITNTGCQLHKDYEAFYDSTMVRFWFYNEMAQRKIQKSLNDKFSDFGFFVDQSNCFKYRIPLDLVSEEGKPVYGDLVWCANPGVLVSPDYFHSSSESENGMHGYIDVVDGHGTGLFVAWYDGMTFFSKDKAHSSEICGELCKLLSIKHPNSNWKRII